MKNILCQRLNIRYPILLGGMLQIGRARLAAAVSEAGGLGILGAGAWTGEELRRQIEEVRQLTAKPFGVNIPVRSVRARELVNVILEEKIQVVTTSAGNPRHYTETLQKGGVYVIHVVPTVDHAQRAQEAGVDAIIAEGYESGGFLSLEEVTTFILVPQVVETVTLPVIAAGGIGNGRGLAAALALGAVGVQVGTRFLASEESEVTPAYKNVLLLARDTDTTVVRGKKMAHRDLKNELLMKVSSNLDKIDSTEWVSLHEQENRNEDEIQAHLQKRKVWPSRSAGQVAGLIHEILPVKEIIDRMVREARTILQSIGNLLPVEDGKM
jgi:enoyl-[acyl-carrier protein] reductase II